MPLDTRLRQLASRVGQEVKAVSGRVGTLADLTTTAKGSVVAAVNEVAGRSAGGGSRLLIASKTADTARPNTDAATADPHLTFDVAPNSVFAVRGLLLVDTTQSADFKAHWTFPSGTITWWMDGPPGNTTSTSSHRHWNNIRRRTASGTASSLSIGGLYTAIGTPIAIAVYGIVRIGATGGTLAFCWAQNLSGADSTTLRTDSYIELASTT